MADGDFVVQLTQTRRDLREEFQAILASQRELLITGGVARHEKAILRIEAVEHAHKAFEENLNRVPTALDREAHRLETLFNEKLNGVAIRIDSFHDYAAAMRETAKEAIAAALASLREITAAQHAANVAALVKTEATTTKELDGIKLLISTTSKSFDTEITNLTDRLNRGEGAVKGGKDVIGFIVGGIGAVAAFVAIFVALHAYSTSPSADTVLIGQRLDALSARINELTPSLKPESK